MSFLRFLMLLSLIVWVGGLIFFAFAVAPSAFALLPTRHMAGNLVGRTLGILHWMGIFSGLIFLGSSFAYAYITRGSAHFASARNLLIIVMLLLTLVSQFGIIPRMDTLRASIGEIDSVPPDNPARMQFDGLHVWSTRVEGGVLLLGLVAVWITASSF
jgi:uncharacterized membrane protein